MTETETMTDRLLDAALIHVVFDGWSDTTFEAAVAETGLDPVVARALFPRRAVDLAIAFHARGDAELRRWLEKTDLSDMRFRDRVAAAVRHRLELAAPHKEAVRRGVALFSLPHYAPDGTRAVWNTVDTIWDALGDSSEDVNWYTKRASLAAVYGATVMFWLGDDSDGNAASWAFLDRRIDNIMQFEKVKAQLRQSKALAPLLAGPNWLASQIRAPQRDRRQGMPGSTGAQGGNS
ncbi:MAG: COQ9 family protein [Brevirhabdus sp.]